MDDVGVKDEQTQSIEQLYEEMGERLWWALLAYSGSREIANDATAEAFARALALSGSIEHPADWVWSVGFRIATKELRSARRHVPLKDLPLSDEDDRTEVLELMAALKKLSRQQRAAGCCDPQRDKIEVRQTDGIGQQPRFQGSAWNVLAIALDAIGG